MPPISAVEPLRHAELPHLRPRRAGRPAHRTALTAVVRPLVLVAIAMLGILFLLPAALQAAVL